jgi:hypothetical protein
MVVQCFLGKGSRIQVYVTAHKKRVPRRSAPPIGEADGFQLDCAFGMMTPQARAKICRPFNTGTSESADLPQRAVLPVSMSRPKPAFGSP